MRHESTTTEESQTGLSFLYRQGASPTAPLVVLVHGRAGNKGVMWTFERCLPEGCHIVSFEAFLPDPIGGWSWWEMTPEGSRREAITHAVARFSRAVGGFCELYSLTPSHALGIGFSQGAVLLSNATLTGATSFEGIALLAGFTLFPSEAPVTSRLRSVFVAHGTADETISVNRARDGVHKLRALGLSVEYIEEDVGHKIGTEGTRALKSWVQGLVHGIE